MPMNDSKAGVFSLIPGVFWWKAGVYFIKSNEYQNRSSLDSFLILAGIDYTYIWFSFIPFTHLFICLIFCWFLWRVWRLSVLLPWCKRTKNQDRIRSFLLKEKNQKFKAHTTEATVLVAALKSRKTRLRLKQPRFFNAPLGRPLHASSVRPKQLKIDDWQLKIYKAGLHGGI